MSLTYLWVILVHLVIGVLTIISLTTLLSQYLALNHPYGLLLYKMYNVPLFALLLPPILFPLAPLLSHLFLCHLVFFFLPAIVALRISILISLHWNRDALGLPTVSTYFRPCVVAPNQSHHFLGLLLCEGRYYDFVSCDWVGPDSTLGIFYA